MRNTFFLTILFLLVIFTASAFSQNTVGDFLISGKVYKFTMKYGSEYTVTYNKQDSIYYYVSKDNQKTKFQKSQIVNIELGFYTVNTNENDTLSIYEIELTDGTEIAGYLIKKDSLIMSVKTIGGVKMDLPLDKIRKTEISRGYSEDNEFFYSDPNQTRLFISPTGRALKQGDGYFSLNELVIPIFAYGVTDFISVAAGMSIVPGLPEQLIYFNLKATPYFKDNFGIGAGIFYIGLTGDGDFSSKVIYGVSTIGSNTAAVTFGLGGGIGSEGDLSSAMFLFGGDVRISKTVKLLSENFILFDNSSSNSKPFSVFSLGVRFFGSRVAGDLGFFTTMETLKNSEGFPFLPWATFTYNF